MTDDNTNKTPESIRDTVIEKIKASHTHMRPRAFFVFQTIALALLGILFGLILLHVVSFIVFELHHNGTWFAPAFGWRGVGILIASLPWLLIVGGIVVFVVLEMLVRRYSFSYRKPLVYTLLAIIVVVAGFSALIERYEIHEKLLGRARDDRLPFVGPLYRGFGMARTTETHVGRIEELTDEGFKMENRLGEELNVIVNSQTQFPSGLDFDVDDQVFVIGHRDDDTVQATGIRSIEGRKHPMPRQGWFGPMSR